MNRPRIVQKFGGTSLATTDLIACAAARAVAARRRGTDVVLVASAMAGETDRLLALAQRVSPDAPKREVDLVAATGEQLSAALLTIAVHALGAKARAFLGHQLPIQTDANHGDALITSVCAEPLDRALAAGEIPIVAGFQGVDPGGNVTTLGRGGSDTTAVAVAAALGAACEIYTDVDGVYSIDPRATDRAQRLAFVGYSTMHALAAAGAKVLERRSVALARDGRVPVHVRSSLADGPGTWIVDDDDERGHDVFGVAVTKFAREPDRAAVSVVGPGAPLRAHKTAHLRLTQAGIPVLAIREIWQGHAFIVRAEDGAIAARTIHAAYGESAVPSSWGRLRVAHPISPDESTSDGR